MTGVKRLVWEDLKKVRARLDEPAPHPETAQATLFE
jgi:hypothetical protein